MDLYVMSCPEVVAAGSAWTMPVLRGSGGHLVDPASVNEEAAATENRFLLSQRMTSSDSNRGVGKC
jgi:hypothetical protein